MLALRLQRIKYIPILGFHSFPGELKENSGHFGVQLVIGETDDKSFVNCTPI